VEITGRYRSIGEIPLPYPLGEKIYPRPGQRPFIELPEAGIDKLVRVINGLGMQTTGSCEGHMHKDRFPWVQIAGLYYPDFWVHQDTVRLTREYNTQKTPDRSDWFVHLWSPEGAYLRTRQIAESEEGLVNLREGADDFAQFLFEKYLKKS
jgi:hypothetical protein